MSSTDRQVGLRLEARRRELGLSVPDLALSLGVAVADVRLMESGRLRLSPEQMVRACTTLDVCIPYFFAESSTRSVDGDTVPGVRPNGPDAR